MVSHHHCLSSPGLFEFLANVGQIKLMPAKDLLRPDAVVLLGVIDVKVILYHAGGLHHGQGIATIEVSPECCADVPDILEDNRIAIHEVEILQSRHVLTEERPNTINAARVSFMITEQIQRRLGLKDFFDEGNALVEFMKVARDQADIGVTTYWRFHWADIKVNVAKQLVYQDDDSAVISQF